VNVYAWSWYDAERKGGSTIKVPSRDAALRLHGCFWFDFEAGAIASARPQIEARVHRGYDLGVYAAAADDVH